MSLVSRRKPVALLAALIGAFAALATAPHASHATPSLGRLSSELAAQQARQQQLAHSVGGLSQGVVSLQGQIALVQRREADVRAQLARDRAALAAVHGRLIAERARVRALRATLAYARMLLSRQLVSSYEGGKPDLVSVVLESNGFAQLLDQVNFLHDAMSAQQRIINVTRAAKALADRAAARLAGLERNDAQLVEASAMQARALAGMDSLLGAKEADLARALSAQEAALRASRDRSSALQTQITQIRAQQAAAAAAAAAQARAARARAAAAAAAPSSGPASAAGNAPVASGPPLGPSGGWAIPYPIVLCESGGQDLPPNSAGASGYYQIMPATWKLYGGSGPAAYLAPKSEQDAVASRIWAGGSGASNWVCAGIVGIH
jgi:septal ring factor EnvC (AmiA/AmiB activator)